MNYKFNIIDHSQGEDHGKLGIFFYDERILFGWEHDFGVRSYRFKCKICINDAKKRKSKQDFDEWMDNIMGRSNRDAYEYLDFIYTCDLKGFINREKCDPRFCQGKEFQEDFDWEKILELAIPKEYQRAKDRLVRKDNKIIPAPTFFEDCYRKQSEFLAFDEDSEHGTFCGNFSHDGKSGCGAKLNFQPNSGDMLKEINFELTSYWDLPESAKKGVNDLAKNLNQENDASNFFWSWTKEEKRAFFDSMSLEQKIAFYKIKLRNLSDKECFESLRPYSIYLYGTDDVSYTKRFNSEEEQLAEMNYLRMMQPLNFQLDILARGYIFTN